MKGLIAEDELPLHYLNMYVIYENSSAENRFNSSNGKAG